jgi:hypothetical protein
MAKIMKKAQSGSSAAKKQVSIPKQFEAKGPQKDVVNAFKNKSSNEPSKKRSNPFGGVGDMSKTRTMRLLSKYAPNEMQKNGGKMKKKAKSGGSFPDLNKDGKITKADILKGRGVIAKKGIKTAKKMKNGGMLAAPTKGGVSMQLGSYTRQIGKNYTGKNVVNKGAKAKMGKSMGKCKYGC